MSEGVFVKERKRERERERVEYRVKEASSVICFEPAGNGTKVHLTEA